MTSYKLLILLSLNITALDLFRAAVVSFPPLPSSPRPPPPPPSTTTTEDTVCLSRETLGMALTDESIGTREVFFQLKCKSVSPSIPSPQGHRPCVKDSGHPAPMR